jgi:hypothetical protein
VFQRVIKSSVRPLQIGRKLIREIDANRTVDARGKAVAPNSFTVHLHEKDRAAFGDLEKALVTELTEAAKEYATSEDYTLLGEVKVALLTDATLKPGKFAIHAEVKPSVGMPEATAEETETPLVEAAPEPEAPEVAPPVVPVAVPVAPVAPPTPPTVATPSIPPVPVPATPVAAPVRKFTLIMGDGARIALKPGVVSIGRSAESTVPLNDSNVSRRHAELRSRGDGEAMEWVVVDLGSTNGTMLNGVKINGEKKLKHGDTLAFGSITARFEVA